MAVLMIVARRAATLLVAATTLAACYQPTLRDCVVSCTSPSDCAGDQVCGANGWCAAQGVVCSLEPDAGVDGADTDAGNGDGSVDDGAIDAAIDAQPIDAGATMRIVITNRGSVVGDFPGVDCMAPPGDCSYGIDPGTVVMLTAVDGPGGHTFIDWTTPNCMGMGRTCTVTVTAPVTLVGASFN